MPQFVLEVVSRRTKDRECKFIKDEYERIGVKECWQLDLSGDPLDRPLVGHRLRQGAYEHLPTHGIREGEHEYCSAQLGLLLRTKPYREKLVVQFLD